MGSKKYNTLSLCIGNVFPSLCIGNVPETVTKKRYETISGNLYGTCSTQGISNFNFIICLNLHNHVCVVSLIIDVYLFQWNSPSFGCVHFVSEDAIENALKVNNFDFNENFGFAFILFSFHQMTGLY